MDGHAMVFRAWFSIPERLSTETGQDTRGAYGFLTTFFKVLREHSPSHVVMTFDTRAPTFRDDLYPNYKAHRPPVDPALHEQIPLVKKIMDSFNVPVYELDGFEADDLVGTLSNQANKLNMDSLILTGDADQLQLVDDRTRVLMYTGFGNSRVYDDSAVKERYDGLGPEYIAEIKALEGDPSDNIPGIPGIGKKTARILLNSLGHFESLFANTSKISEIPSLRGARRIQEIIEKNKKVAYDYLKLTTIVRTAPISLDFDKSEFGNYDRNIIVGTLSQLEFRSIIRQIPESPEADSATKSSGNNVTKKSTENVNYRVITEKTSLIAMIDELTSGGDFAFDTETSGLNAMQANLVGISFSEKKGSAWYIPLGHANGDQIPKDQALDLISKLFSDPDLSCCAHNANFDLTILKNAGVEVKNLTFDTMVAAFLCGKRSIGLKNLAFELFNEEMTPITNLIGSGRNQISMADVSIAEVTPYACADADFTLQLKHELSPLLTTNNVEFVNNQIEIPLIPVILEMQTNGMLIDSDLLQKMSVDLSSEIDQIKQVLLSTMGEEDINLNSNQQLANLLITKLGAPKTRKTKTGFSMDSNSLENIIHTSGLDDRIYEISSGILKYRELTKLKSTYVDALPQQINTKTGRVHSRFNQVGTSTGRISSNDPNIQNIPVRSDLGRNVRKAFTSDHNKGWQFLAADYSQIELRILAHLAEEPSLISAFKNNEDIHSSTAKTIYGVEDVQPNQRRIAKILNFGIIYGLGPIGVARQTDLSREQGREFIDLYFGKYPGIRDYIEKQKQFTKNRGYAETVTGRRRYLPDIRSNNPRIRGNAERASVNMPIQGTSADVIKIAMINIYRELKLQNMLSKLVAQVHDELIFEISPGELMEMQEMVTRLMPNAIELKVPLNVETKTGLTWGDME